MRIRNLRITTVILRSLQSSSLLRYSRSRGTLFMQWRNYQTLMKTFENLNEIDRITRTQQTMQAYEVVTNEKLREDYMHALIIRCYLSQPFELQISKKDSTRLWPFFIFEIIQESSTESDIMQFNFVEKVLTEQRKEVRRRSFVFSNISSALFSKKDDEFIINYIDNGKILSQNYKAKFQNQRDQIVKLAIFAKEIFEETKPTLEFHNPNNNQDMRLFKVQHFSIGENSKVNTKVEGLFQDQVSTKSNFLWDDSYIPGHALLKSQAEKLGHLGKAKLVYFTLGKTQILLSRDEAVKQIILVIPLKKEYLAFSREEQIVSLQVLNTVRKYKFADKQSATQFIQKLTSVQNQKAQVSILKTEHPAANNLESIARNQKETIYKINQQIADFENRILKLKQQRQQIYSELSDLNLDYIDEHELQIKY